ncbi:outer membrane beta-barrel protein [Dysgonomonas sp. Marseille-P4677]|uniref:outer membrane beta-barrel protein n=1 Tax=Dysgonomonas sp. Marseille-P4677 TaxID=2364790 RepID=UPI0019117318|nr:outer membrane beta-barrel protein [Dysgonomonas sp. Marseille-P4677]MBK5719609.1 outer membrane beta-barrel protein [Dysgonomonas sp. Marseille-P4677]
MFNKYIIMMAIGISAYAIAPAQSLSNHEISVWGSGGLSTLKSDLNVGDSENKAGGAFGIGYNYHINENWSLLSGLEMAFYHGESSISEFTDSYNANDGEFDFIYHTSANKYREDQKSAFLNIPIMAQFQNHAFNSTKYYIAGGFKIGIPVSKKMTVENVDFDNYGYYPEWENPIQDDPYFMGFGSFKSQNKKGNLDLNLVYILSLETGFRWPLSDNMNLYTGIYCDYGLNDIKKNGERLIQYNTALPEDYIHNSMLNSFYTIDNNEVEITNKVNLFAVGLKLRLSFGI